MAIRSVPFGYTHPSKQTRTQQGKVAVATPSPEFKRRKLKKPEKPKPSISTETKIIRILASVPIKGQHSLFDQMIESGLSPRVAILGIFKLGFATAMKSVSEGAIDLEPRTLKKTGNPIETSRIVSTALFDAVRSAFDPFDILSRRALGVRLGEFILHETKHIRKPKLQ